MAPPFGRPQETAGTFRTTHWTVVMEAARPDGDGGEEAFARLYSDYWSPLYGFVRRRGHSPEEAEDITQDFFVRLLEKQSLAGLTREGGRFRSVLLRTMTNYLANEWDRARAQKRGGGQKPLPLDVKEGENRLVALEVSDRSSPETLFEKQWVFTVLGRVMSQLRTESGAGGRAELFDDLRPCLQGDRTGPAYADIAARRGMTEGAVKVTVHRLRQRYGELLRDEIARTVSRPEEVDDELRHLMSVLGR